MVADAIAIPEDPPMTSRTPPEIHGPPTFDVYDLLTLLWKQRTTLIIATLCGVGLGVAAAFLLTPIYRAEATVQIRTGRDNAAAMEALGGQLGPLGTLAGAVLGPRGDERGVALATLQSRAIIKDFIERNDLLPIIFRRKWDSANKRWKRNDPQYVPTSQDGFRKFREDIFSVTDDKKSGLVIVAVEWRDPVLAARWLEGLIADANESLKETAIRESEANLRYLETQARNTSIVELRLALYKLMENEHKKLMIARNTEDYVFRTIDPAEIPRKKVRPQRALIIALSGALGLSAGVAVVLIVAAYRRRQQARWMEGGAS